MIASILTSVKKNLGVAESQVAFDPDILMYINGALSTLNQLGIGPDEGFRVEDDSETWDDFLGDDPNWDDVRIYVTLRVKMLFDPPPTSFAQQAFKEQIEELAVRLNVRREDAEWTDPTLLVP